MKTLDRKLLRDLWSLKGQVLAIAMVIASGVAFFVMSLTTVDALRITQSAFYRDYVFADGFAGVKRAPNGLAARLREIPGVDRIETRVVAHVNLEVEGFDEPISGRLVSLPDGRQPAVNRLYLRSGRLPEPERSDEVVVSEVFALAHGLQPGDRLAAVINGRWQRLSVVGIGLSPEFVYQIQPGKLFPDHLRYGVLWMNETPLATAYDLDGAFNDVVFTLFPGTRRATVLERIDAILAPYGGVGAFGRDDQLSHRYLSAEFDQLEEMATLFPVIFLAVAAFLLNVVVSRLIGLQRELIAVLKAFGYRDREVGLHYLELVIVIVVLGALLGVAGGVWMGSGLAALYRDFFFFPFLHYRLQPSVVVSAVLISVLAGAAGTLHAVRKAARLPPAEAMSPEPPASYHVSWIERLGGGRLLSQPARMIVRNLQRHPVKALLSIIGIAASCAILVLGSYQRGAINHIVDIQFNQSQRDDMTVTLVEPTSRRALFELLSLPGVDYVEPFRSVPVLLRNAQHEYRTALQGLPARGELLRLLDTDQRRIVLPEEGVVLTDFLADELRVRPGDRLIVEVQEGGRPVLEVPVAGLVKQYVGVGAYMEIGALSRMLQSSEAVSGAFVLADSAYHPSIYHALGERPRVAGVSLRVNAIGSFYETMAETVLIFTFISTLLAGSIAFGVVYNNARIALSERSRELASLRVLGLTRGEVGYILLGELVLLTLVAILLGFVLGYGLVAYLVASLSIDLYRVPLVVEPIAYAYAATVVLVATILSGLFVWYRLGRLDLVAVLKTRE